MTTFRRAAGIALALYLGGGILVPAHARTRQPQHPTFVTEAKLTWYPLAYFQGKPMADGNTVYEGAFACPRDYMGATVTILAVGISGTCEDTGAAWWFAVPPFKLDVAAWSRPDWMPDALMEVDVEWP